MNTDTAVFSTNLGHSLNSRGELGMFVNPFTCSCTTCANYLAEHEPHPPSPEVLTPPVLAEAADSPPPLLTSHLALGRAPANQTWDGSAWIPSAPPLVRVNAFFPRDARTEQDELLSRLRALRDQLHEEQDQIYEGEARSHDEMAAQDIAWNEIDEKIMAIDNLLQVFDPLELRSSH